MATVTATNAAAGFPRTTPNDGTVAVAYGFYEYATNPTLSDTADLCWLPKGAVVVGGKFYADPMEADGTPTLAFTLGTASDTDEFIAATTFSQNGRQCADFYANTAQPSGVALTADTKVLLTWTAAATSFVAGGVMVAVYYVMPVNG